MFEMLKDEDLLWANRKVVAFLCLCRLDLPACGGTP